MPPQFNEPFGNSLDTESTPRFLMIPQGQQKTMLLSYSNGEMVTSHNKNIITLEEEDRNTWAKIWSRPTTYRNPNYSNPLSVPSRKFEITGKSPGTTSVDVDFVPQLEVSVKTQMTYEIAFHFVEDTVGNKTTRPPGIAADLIRALDWIYEPRTNVSFQIKRAAPTNMNVYLPEFFRERRDEDLGLSRSQREWNYFIDKGEAGALFNIFFVASVKPKKSNDPFPLMHTMGNICVCDDDRLLDTIIQILSHDVGVAMGCNSISDPKRKHHLMYESPVDRINLRRTGDFIPKDYVNIMNPSGL
jgi:hypothetical protein